jgi:hypothetical protein
MIEYDDYKVKINALKPTLTTLGAALKLDEAAKEAEKLEKESEADGFWSDIENSQKVQQRLKQFKNKLDKYKKLESNGRTFLPCARWLMKRMTKVFCPNLRRNIRPSKKSWKRRAFPPCFLANTTHAARSSPSTPRRRDRGAGLDADAVQDVHPLGRAPRLQIQAARLS